MQKNVTHKFNYKKAVNNRYKPIYHGVHKMVALLHTISKEQVSYDNYYNSACFEAIYKELLCLDVVDLLDYDRYERWLEDGGRY